MQTDQTNLAKQSIKNRRTFLKSTAAALLAGAALPNPSEARVDVGPFDRHIIYQGGIVSNRDLGVIFNVYLAIDPDGTGLGTLSDPIHPIHNSYLAVQQTTGQGNQVRFEGVVSASNTPEQVGQPFVVAGAVQQDFTALEL